jgi:hypothetical protein
MAFKIEKLTAFVAVDDKGEEGIMGSKMADGSWMPLIFADEKRLEQIYPIAVEISKMSGMRFRVIQFDNRVDVTERTRVKFEKS